MTYQFISFIQVVVHWQGKWVCVEINSWWLLVTKIYLSFTQVWAAGGCTPLCSPCHMVSEGSRLIKGHAFYWQRGNEQRPNLLWLLKLSLTHVSNHISWVIASRLVTADWHCPRSTGSTLSHMAAWYRPATGRGLNTVECYDPSQCVSFKEFWFYC